MGNPIISLFFCGVLLVSGTVVAQQTVGVFQIDENAWEGYTLFGPSASRTTYLIDNCGRAVHQWESNFTPGVSTYLLPSGNLLRTGRVGGTPFNGGGLGGQLEILDWNSNVEWSWRYANNQVHQHHDIEPLPNGNILVLAWELRSSDDAISNGRDPNLIINQLWPEQIMEIKPVGSDSAEIVWEWHVWDHLIQDFDATKDNYGIISDHPELININYTGDNPNSVSPDWLHANSVSYDANLDQIMISSRVFNEVWVIDHSTTTLEAAGHTGGRYGKGGDLLYRWGNPAAYERGSGTDKKLFGQHDAHWIPKGYPDEGKIMVFNNGWGRPGGFFSTVDIFTPPYLPDSSYALSDTAAFGPDQLSWSYSTPDPSDLYSRNISGARRLPNGNTLICEGNDGRFLEIAPDLSQVWEYVNPVNSFGVVAQYDPPGNNSVFRVTRHPADYTAFEGRDLTPGEPIEIDPLDIDCPFTTSVSPFFEQSGFMVFPNPFLDYIRVQAPSASDLLLTITDALGRKIHTQRISDPITKINTGSWPGGLYFLYINDHYIQKLIK